MERLGASTTVSLDPIMQGPPAATGWPVAGPVVAPASNHLHSGIKPVKVPFMEIREKLLEAAARVFAETGYRGATTRRIAQEAGVNEVTLFRHFGSKAELILAAVHHVGDAPPQASLPAEPEDPARELTEWAQGHLHHLSGVAPLIRATIGGSEEHEELASCGSQHPRRVGHQLREYLVRLQERGLASREFDPSVAASMLMGTLFSDAMGRDFMPDVYALPQDEMASAYVRLFAGAIGARSGLESRAGSAGQSR